MFKFLKYTYTANYDNLAKYCNCAIFADVIDLNVADKNLILNAMFYKTDLARKMGIAFQCLQKGFIPANEKHRNIIQDLEVSNIDDNYKFIQRYFGFYKATFVLIIRLCTLNNPLTEVYAFLKSTSQTRNNPFELYKKHEAYLTFKSPLLKEQPLVTVVIPTLNRYPYLKEVLSDLEKQTYKCFEVQVCDQSEPFDETFL